MGSTDDDLAADVRRSSRGRVLSAFAATFAMLAMVGFTALWALGRQKPPEERLPLERYGLYAAGGAAVLALGFVFRFASEKALDQEFAGYLRTGDELQELEQALSARGPATRKRPRRSEAAAPKLETDA